MLKRICKQCGREFGTNKNALARAEGLTYGQYMARHGYGKDGAK